ncbi:MAG: DUF1553 domain-containing protein [Planctomycetaceae bacterium]|nr:DUF1553 domain-containing protein [Planctomycetaceae bacterium]
MRWFSLLLSLLAPITASADPVADFERQMVPLIAVRCLSCHAGDDPKGKLDLTTRAAALKGGESGPAINVDNPSASLIWERIAAGDMPPKEALPTAEQRLFANWLEAGAVWSDGPIGPLRYSSGERAGYDWWSLQPLTRPAAPVDQTGWSRSAIDAFVQAQRSAAGLTAAPAADRRVLIRRLSFDLLGLPPSPDEVDAFVHDPAPDAYEQLVDRWLNSPHYGERWARHWLDVVRFGESNGFERDLPRTNAWHYRNWVIDALNRDLPYDEFVRWQLAGDSIAPDDPEALRALGFLVAGPHDTVVPVVDRMRQMMRQDEMEDVIGVVSQTFLGLTANCARCHDHKFDPISAKEYYQLAAALSGADHGEQTIIPPNEKRQLAEWDRQIAALKDGLQKQAEPLAAAILRERSAGTVTTPAVITPTPLAAWDFTVDLQDKLGGLHGRAQGNARVTPQGLELDGQSFVATAPLTRTLTEKTLEVRVKLADLDQKGGGAMSVQTLDGAVFDAVVFAEQQPRRWLAGSNVFERTKAFDAASEDHAAREFVTVTLGYRPDGTIAGYRNGQPYGRPYPSSGPATFAEGKAQILFGLRHGSPGGNKQLKGTISGAKLYDRALTDDEVAASAMAGNTIVTEAEILARLTDDDRQRRQQQTAELSALKTRHAELAKSAPITMYTAAFHQPQPMKVLRRGSVTDPGDVVSPRGLAAINGLPPDFGLRPDAVEYQRRSQLAQWITDRRNPLFARVMANRLWHYHFGQGLVATPNDLGFHSGRPSHPELLDWLASEFVESGYSIKHLHRLMVTSATYRQVSTHNEHAVRVDAQNRLLWRMNPRRLDAESLRDAVLSVAGELNAQIGGKGYTDFNSYFFKGTQFYDPLDAADYSQQRRTVYRMWARGGRSPFLDTFDCPDPSTTTPTRSATTTPLQALSLMNNAFMLRMSDRLAARLVHDAGDDLSQQIDLAYRVAYGRRPALEEVPAVRAFAKRHGLPAMCRGLLNASEFLYVD